MPLVSLLKVLDEAGPDLTEAGHRFWLG